jgi:colanic acid/amylovoran biosynthesis glycosyltransferase
MGQELNIVLVRPRRRGVSETFIDAQSLTLSPKMREIGSSPFFKRLPGSRALATIRYKTILQRNQPDIVLAQYGPIGVEVSSACSQMRIPLAVYFHGFDASVESVLDKNRESYRHLFAEAGAIIGSSKLMRDKLIDLGSPAKKTFYVPYGVDCEKFRGAEPEKSLPLFLSVGRFVEKKGQVFSLRAFARVFRRYPESRLKMVGTGPELEFCRKLAAQLGIASAVEFVGEQPHQAVMQEMKRARAFVQHSLRAATGDSEGTPVAILEAGACGLPVVATRHGGIPEIISHARTGYLVLERDVESMADYMEKLISCPQIAGQMGRAAREKISCEFSLKKTIPTLAEVLRSAVASHELKAQPGIS